MNILAYQLAAPLVRGPYRHLPEWLASLRSCPFSGFVERAIWGGFHADRLGYAFAGGYGAAIARLFDHAAAVQQLPAAKPFPDPPLASVVCLAATEKDGAHPRSITTRLDKQAGAQVLNGEKTFATLGSIADELLVVASRGIVEGGKNRLRIVRVDRKSRGVRVEPRDATPFAPEVPHARIAFVDVHVEDRDVLPGDGYDVYLKPFRTIEDTHVLAATVGYLSGAARAYEWDRAVSAELASLSLALIDIGARDPLAPVTHLALAGIFGSVRRLVSGLDSEWAKSDAGERERWHRDLPLMLVAESARKRRLETAYETIVAKATAPR